VLQPQVHIFGLLSQFDINIDTIASIESFIEGSELFLLDGSRELIFMILDLLDNLETTTDWSFLIG
jgi:hypothetical protein